LMSSDFEKHDSVRRWDWGMRKFGDGSGGFDGGRLAGGGAETLFGGEDGGAGRDGNRTGGDSDESLP
jgi:hypothetical protein